MTTSETLDLKPCPFCGVHLFHNGATELGDIYEHPNNGCAIQVAWFTATDEWVERWNRRPSITDSQVEAAARAIYDAEDKLSGDAIATVIISSDHLFPSREHYHGNPSSKAYQLAAMDVCRTAARAALESALSSSSPVPVGEWKPIEDGRPYGPVTVCRFGDADHSWLPMTAYRNFGKWERPASRDGLPYEPTHWQLLPSPPQEQANGGE